MQTAVNDAPVYWWVAFNAFILVMLALDLGVFHRKAHRCLENRWHGFPRRYNRNSDHHRFRLDHPQEKRIEELNF